MKKNLRFPLLALTAVAMLTSGCKSEKKNSVEAEFSPVAELTRVETPTALSDSVTKMLAKAESDSLEIHSIMVVKDGNVLYEKWLGENKPEEPHILNSVSKTFTSMGVGLAIADSLLTLDDKLVDIFPEETPADAGENLKAITVRDLLTMTCGHAEDHTYEMQAIAKENPGFDWVKQFLSYPVEYKPGTVYCYNSVGTYMLAAIVQKVTGKKLLEYLNDRVLDPLGIKEAFWQESTQGVNYGGWGLYLNTESLAKAGQLLLQKGKWGDSQLLPEEWVEEMSHRQVQSSPAGINSVELDMATADPDWVQGYGYQMWICRNNAFRADGARGQYIIVLPDQNSVVAMTANTTRMQDELQLVWDYVLPVLNNR